MGLRKWAKIEEKWPFLCFLPLWTHNKVLQCPKIKWKVGGCIGLSDWVNLDKHGKPNWSPGGSEMGSKLTQNGTFSCFSNSADTGKFPNDWLWSEKLVQDLAFQIRPVLLNIGSLTGHQGARKWGTNWPKMRFFAVFSTLQTKVSSIMTKNKVKS